ncbi:unnamed protein product [Brachionus calyciflorus]|uniref:Cytochrome b5 heme-binding domain-containing protein n=1 Tax=Brachionus calyciflorus TaxID=104777 RepID=A0A813LY22_9BILA|nr:unnamed protein product [Brachionus calyciflorus]
MLKKALIVIITAVLFKSFLEYWFGPRVDIKEVKIEEIPKIKVFQNEDLKSQERLFLAILGNVYDVTKGAQHYQKGGSYEFFVGRDASRAYVTGDFKNDLNDQVDDLSNSQVKDLFNWKSFYDNSYTHLGVLDGRFYNSKGEKTENLLKLEKINEAEIQTAKKNSEYHERFPICNSEWTQEKGIVKLWCTTESGGVKRSWSGYPRLVYNPISKQDSCACVNENDLNHPNVKLYPNCDPKSDTCRP